MTPQPPRLKAGTCKDGTAVGGQWTSKTVPAVKEDPFNIAGDTPGTVGDRDEWAERTAELWGLSTTFTRTVNDDGTVTFTCDCDPPDMMLLARRGDEAYWYGDTWANHNEDRRLWCADIAVNMLNEGYVADTASGGAEGIETVMTAAGSLHEDRWELPYKLTAVVAQIRGLRLIQSMAPKSTSWATELGGYDIPKNTSALLMSCFNDTDFVYQTLLHRPPLGDGEDWGPQEVAGHATTNTAAVFVGEHGDLLWRALAENDLHGMSPLKTVLTQPQTFTTTNHLIAAAVLYDETAEQQLTTGLFDGVALDEQWIVQDRVLEIFRYALTPYIQRSWTNRRHGASRVSMDRRTTGQDTWVHRHSRRVEAVNICTVA